MIKILHAADLHLDSAFVGHDEATAAYLRAQLRAIPEKIAELCKKENCELLLLPGDLFDGAYTKESALALKNALEEAAVPTFISPGNHDFYTENSPWRQEKWPKNVHIFREPTVESVSVEALDCRVYGAGFVGMDCEPLLNGFCRAEGERYHIGVFHADPTHVASPYNAVSAAQVRDSGLDYLALGHVHSFGSFRAGGTLCAWPGCPMGRGYDETGEKGILLVTLNDSAEARFLPLDTPRFYDWEAPIRTTAEDAIADRLPASANADFYRITLTEEAEKPNLEQLRRKFSAFAHLQLRDRTQPPTDLWGSAGEDSLEGLYFRLLRDSAETEDAELALLAARISRKILDGSEVTLP